MSERDAIERAARRLQAEQWLRCGNLQYHTGYDDGMRDISAAIRALPPAEPEEVSEAMGGAVPAEPTNEMIETAAIGVAVAACALVIATDGSEAIRSQRKAVLEACKTFAAIYAARAAADNEGPDHAAG